MPGHPRRSATWVARGRNESEAAEAPTAGGDAEGPDEHPPGEVHGGERGDDWWHGYDPWSGWHDSHWGHSWSGSHNYDSGGWNRGGQDGHAVRVEETTMAINGRWWGSSQSGFSSEVGDGGRASGFGELRDGGKPSERLTVPDFDGEATDQDLGSSARSYLRKVKVWVRCTKLPPGERVLALYTHLKGKAWLIAEELDVDMLAQNTGVDYFTDWIRVRFMEVEITKIGTVMTALFRRCRRKPEQSVREFNLEFERLLLHLVELGCELPGLVKGWLYLDRLKLGEGDELALLASVQNQYDLKLLQQAAIIQDRGGARRWADKPKGKWQGHRNANSVHFTEGIDSDLEDEDVEEPHADEGGSDVDVVPEEVAASYHDAFIAFQDAKSKYREAMKGRGYDGNDAKKRSEERLKAAKARSYCSACKRKGHWHRDPECPLRGKGGGDTKPQTANACHTVYVTELDDGDGSGDLEEDYIQSYMTEDNLVLASGVDRRAGDGHLVELKAITDTACSKTVAGHPWYESYCQWADDRGEEINIVEDYERFKFGASRVHESHFAVWCKFGVQGKHFQVKVAIVACDVPLLFSRSVLAKLGMVYDIKRGTVDLVRLGVREMQLSTSETGHPALLVTDYGPNCFEETSWTPDPEVMFGDQPAKEQYVATSGVQSNYSPIFYPKKVGDAVRVLLLGETLQPNTFYMWWKGANQSRDFWVENEEWMIRVHVVPRKGRFNPKAWNTQQRELKDRLLNTLGDECWVDVLPCHGNGLAMHNMKVTWKVPDDHGAVGAVDAKIGEFGLWIGRSRFKKVQDERASSEAHVVERRFTMEDEEGRVDPQAGGGWGRGAPQVDRTGASADAGGVLCPGQGGGEREDQEHGGRRPWRSCEVRQSARGSTSRPRPPEGC